MDIIIILSQIAPIKKLCIILVFNFTPISGPLFGIFAYFLIFDYRKTLFDNLHFSPDDPGEVSWGVIPPMLFKRFKKRAFCHSESYRRIRRGIWPKSFASWLSQSPSWLITNSHDMQPFPHISSPHDFLLRHKKAISVCKPTVRR